MLGMPTLDGKVDYNVLRAIRDIVTYVNDLETAVQRLQQQVQGLPAPLTVQQISRELSATGTSPLNIAGLVGTPAIGTPGP
jgi:hypothetical protein